MILQNNLGSTAKSSHELKNFDGINRTLGVVFDARRAYSVQEIKFRVWP
jgi:hypothetical protein